MNRSESKYFNTAAKMNEALISILENKEYEYITIKEICEKAKVNRSTFYLHYENIGDLLAETVENMLESFRSYFPSEFTDIIDKFSDCKLEDLNFITDKYMHPYLSYIRDNKKVFSTAITHINVFGLENVYKNLFNHIFNPILDRFDYPMEDREYVMAFYLNGINAIVTRWLKNDCDISIEKVSDIIFECIFGKNTEFLSQLK